MQNSSGGRAHISVIIPTYQRRDVVLASVRALARQEFSGTFEVIVVVDGSTDGSAQALRELGPPFPLTVLEQPNQGRAAAVNRGVAVAQGQILLFLDDDMEAHPHLLAEHARSHREGADMVLGHIPLHPESPSNFLSAAVGLWAEQRVQRLSSPGATIDLYDLITGQASVSKDVFDKLGGFDTNFNHGGSFGDEDYDFGHRFRLAGYRLTFNPAAISWQKYIVTPRHHLRQWRQAGRADVVFARKHPEQAKAIFALHPVVSLLGRLMHRLLRRFDLLLIDKGIQNQITTRLFFWVRELEYWQGVREAGGIPKPWPLRVLAYHAIADLAGDPILEQYGIPADLFQSQLDMLQQAGYQFVNADEFLRFLNGEGGLPRHPLLLTFDDCYEDILAVALPILKERNIPAVAFAVSKCLGGTNDWDKALGAPQLRLLDAEGLGKLAAEGIEIGAHSRTHRPLTQVPAEELCAEITGSVDDLEALGLNRPRLFAYPHGENDSKVQQAIKESGLQAAFTVRPGWVVPNHNPYQIPRIEIMRADVGWKFRWKVAAFL
jgi:GT2 family glycosyltransferase/peptidoglycan/xylan/chitin deacetylase (PgdA/CDA1 family)